MYSNIQIRIALVMAIASTVNSCSVPRGWRPKDLPERAKSAEIVLYGKVTKSPTKWYHPISKKTPILHKERGIYSAEVEVYCIFKGEIGERFLNITGYGYMPGYCVDDHVIEGEKAIFFVRYDRSGQPVAQNVNVQRSTAIVDAKTLTRVIKATEISAKKSTVQRSNKASRKLRGGCPMMTFLLWRDL